MFQYYWLFCFSGFFCSSNAVSSVSMVVHYVSGIVSSVLFLQITKNTKWSWSHSRSQPIAMSVEGCYGVWRAKACGAQVRKPWVFVYWRVNKCLFLSESSMMWGNVCQVTTAWQYWTVLMWISLWTQPNVCEVTTIWPWMVNVDCLVDTLHMQAHETLRHLLLLFGTLEKAPVFWQSWFWSGGDHYRQPWFCGLCDS